MIRKVSRLGQNQEEKDKEVSPNADSAESVVGKTNASPSAAHAETAQSTSRYDDIPFLGAWAMQNKDRTQMFAWWDAMESWIPTRPELVKTTKDAIVTITLEGKPFASYADLDSYTATYDKNPNLAVDKWLAAMERSLPEEIVISGESAINPRWLKPKSIYTGIQGWLGQSSTSSAWQTILVALAILFVVGGGIYIFKDKLI